MSAVSQDAAWRTRLLDAGAGKVFAIDRGPTARTAQLLRRWGLRYSVSVARMVAARTAVLVVWAPDFPAIGNTALIFSFADLGLFEPRRR